MAPRESKEIGLKREDVARDRMNEYGFEKSVINDSIKQVLEVYGEDQWFLIEDDNYAALLSVCLEKQKEQEEEKVSSEKMEMAPKESSKTELRREDAAGDRMKEHGFEKSVINDSIKQVLEVYGEDQWFLIEDANYAALLSVCLEKQKEYEDKEKEADTIGNGEVIDSSQAPLHFVEGSTHPVGGDESSHCGWLSREEEMNPDEDTDSDDDEIIYTDSDGDEIIYNDSDDDEIIYLTPEPLCEELEELLGDTWSVEDVEDEVQLRSR